MESLKMHPWNKGLLCLLILSCIVEACLCYAQEKSNDEEEQCNLTPFSKSSNDFGFKLATELTKKDPDGMKNLFISPLSIFMALSMVYLGAAGKTASEMREAFQLKQNGLEDKDLHESSKDLVVAFENGNDQYTLSLANAIFAQENFKIKDNYTISVEDFYHAVVRLLDFEKKGEEAKTEINHFVSDKTHEMIKELLKEPLDTSTVMVLINAIYFKGTWKTEFPKNQTKEGTFTKRNGETKKVDFMHHQNQKFYFYEDADRGFKFLQLPYKGGDIVMLLALPNDTKNELNVNSDVICEINYKLRKIKLNNVKIPKLNLQYRTQLVNPLHSLGIKDLFQRGANLSEISNDPNLAVSEVLHEAIIKVNEEGSEAAAVTSVTIVTLSIPIERNFIADHTFLFFIVDKRSNLILFSGRVNDP